MLQARLCVYSVDSCWKGEEMRRLFSGFTIIELVLVLVVIGLLSAVAIPRYIQYSEQKLKLQKLEVAERVREAMLQSRAKNKVFPSILELAGQMQDYQTSVKKYAVIVNVQGSEFTVPTYVDVNCTTPTLTLNDAVRCVGEVP